MDHLGTVSWVMMAICTASGLLCCNFVTVLLVKNVAEILAGIKSPQPLSRKEDWIVVSLTMTMVISCLGMGIANIFGL